MKNRVLAIISLLLAFCVLFGCATTGKTGTEPSAATTQASDGKAEVAKRTDLNICLETGFKTAHPFTKTLANEMQVLVNVYEGLMAWDDNAIRNCLIDGYDISADGTVYTFKLIKGVKFHNGEEMKASDVVYSFNAAKEAPQMASYMANYVSAEAVDEYTVKVTLDAPSGVFLTNCVSIYVVSEKFATGADLSTTACGTGPYKMTDCKANEYLTLEAFDAYHGDKALIQKISIKVIADANTRVSALVAGELDWLNVPTSSWEHISTNDKYHSEIGPSGSFNYLSMNTENEILKNVKVRQAIAYALNKDDIIMMALDGLGVKADTICNPEVIFGGASEGFTVYETNVDKAKALLSEAGYPNGVSGLTITCVGNTNAVAVVIKDQLAAIGIDVKIEVGDNTNVLPQVNQGNYDMYIGGYRIMYDANASMPLVTTANINVFNKPRYSNAEVDRLSSEAATSTDSKERVADYLEIWKILSNDLPYIPLYYTAYTWASDKNLNFVYEYPFPKLAKSNW